MAERVEIINKILRDYEDIRGKTERDRAERTERINEQYPRIAELVTLINEGGHEMVNKIKRDPQNQQKYLNEYAESMKKLRAEKEYIMVKNNIPADYDKVRHVCEKCSDTGFLPDGEKCSCFLQKLINYAYEQSDMGKMIEKCNFDTFNINYYSKKKPDGFEESPYEYMENVLMRCKNFCRDFDNREKGIIFTGNPGLGKTFLSSCIAKELMDMGKSVIYKRAPRLFMLYNEYRFSRDKDREFLENLYGCDLLIIDDLGVEEVNQSSRAFFIDLLDERGARSKKTIITTNLNMNEITRIYSSRLTSRIYENFIMFGLYGEDIRIQKLKNNV